MKKRTQIKIVKIITWCKQKFIKPNDTTLKSTITFLYFIYIFIIEDILLLKSTLKYINLLLKYTNIYSYIYVKKLSYHITFTIFISLFNALSYLSNKISILCHTSQALPLHLYISNLITSSF